MKWFRLQGGASIRFYKTFFEKKCFFKSPTLLWGFYTGFWLQKSFFFENATGAFRCHFRAIYASYDHVMHTFSVPQAQINILVVIRASPDPPIRCYCIKYKKTSFFKNGTPMSRVQCWKNAKFGACHPCFSVETKNTWNFLVVPRMCFKMLLVTVAVEWNDSDFNGMRQLDSSAEERHLVVRFEHGTHMN